MSDNDEKKDEKKWNDNIGYLIFSTLCLIVLILTIKYTPKKDWGDFETGLSLFMTFWWIFFFIIYIIAKNK